MDCTRQRGVQPHGSDAVRRRECSCCDHRCAMGLLFAVCECFSHERHDRAGTLFTTLVHMHAAHTAPPHSLAAVLCARSAQLLSVRREAADIVDKAVQAKFSPFIAAHVHDFLMACCRVRCRWRCCLPDLAL